MISFINNTDYLIIQEDGNEESHPKDECVMFLSEPFLEIHNVNKNVKYSFKYDEIVSPGPFGSGLAAYTTLLTYLYS